MPADHFLRDPRGHRLEVEAPRLHGHLRAVQRPGANRSPSSPSEIRRSPAARSHRRPRRPPRWCRCDARQILLEMPQGQPPSGSRRRAITHEQTGSMPPLLHRIRAAARAGPIRRLQGDRDRARRCAASGRGPSWKNRARVPRGLARERRAVDQPACARRRHQERSRAPARPGIAEARGASPSPAQRRRSPASRSVPQGRVPAGAPRSPDQPLVARGSRWPSSSSPEPALPAGRQPALGARAAMIGNR